MQGQNELHELSDGAKRAIVNLIDTRIEERIRDLFPTREDFSELKSVVQDLALAVRDTQKAVKELTQAQARTEQRVDELAQAQTRTEQRLDELAQAQRLTEMEMRNLAKSVGKLSDSVVYGLEDVAHVVLPGYLERHLGIVMKEFRRKFFAVNGENVEINLYGEGKRNEKRVTILGECKVRFHPREVKTFLRQVEKVRKTIKGEILLVIFGFWIHPAASTLAKEKGVHPVVSYER